MDKLFEFVEKHFAKFAALVGVFAVLWVGFLITVLVHFVGKYW